jgi:LPS sulfotransferase NodH
VIQTIKKANHFIVLGTQRTGSNLVQSLLNSHPNALCLGEVFNQGIRTDMLGAKKCLVLADDWLVNLSTRELRCSDQQQLNFLDVFLKRAYPNIECTGFRLFYEHTRNSVENALWRSLKRRPNLLYIHLMRRNHLRRYVSLMLARQTDLWVSEDSAKDLPTIRLEQQDCAAYFNKAENTVRTFKGFLCDSDVLELYYEDLVTDYLQQMNRVLDRLGLEKQSLSTRLKKINTSPLDECIQNYAELKDSFAGSPWEYLFDE